MSVAVRPRLKKRPGRRLARVVLILLALLLVAGLVLTSAAPLVPERAAPSAEEVAAGRDAYRQLGRAKGAPAGAPVVLGPHQLNGLGALASHGFRPDRLRLAVRGERVVAQGSHQLPLGRWLNVEAIVEAPSLGFPRTRLKVGAVPLPAFLSRIALQAGRFLLDLRNPGTPPLDRVVRDFAVRDGLITARVSLPGKTGLIDQMAGAMGAVGDADAVVRIYCEVAHRQRLRPSDQLAEQVRRVWQVERGGAAAADFNRAAFLALGMLVVDEKVGDFAGSARDDIGGCRIPPLAVKVHGREDWPKHWALSAALAVGAGQQLSEAMGEWKELADSLARTSTFAVGDPTGFSMADLAADRAGFGTAQAGIETGRADEIARRLASATPDQLLPRALVQREDGLTNAEFVRRYGGIDDPRFAARVREIDAELARSGLR